MTKRKQYRINVRMDATLYADLKRIADGSNESVAEVLRVAGREYIDQRGESTANRRYYTGRFREEVRRLRRDGKWQMHLIIILTAEIGSILIRQLIDMDEETAADFTPGNLLKRAEERLIESGWRVQQRVNTAINEAELNAQKQLDQYI